MTDTKTIVENIILQATEGEKSTLLASVELEDIRKELEESLKLIKEFKDENVEEIAMWATDYPEGFGGYKFEYRSGGNTFSYKNSAEWVMLDAQKKAVEKRMKEAFTQQQKGLTMVDAEGEVIEPATATPRKASVIFKAIKR